MTDISVYYFIRDGGPGGKALLSKRRATLEAIKDRGEAVLQSRRIVDHTEVDGNGFLIGAGDEAHPVDELWSRIRSFESRANSRDSEALKIVEPAERDRENKLRSESLELREQARLLRKRIDRPQAEGPGHQGGVQDLIGYGYGPQTG